MVGVMFAAVHTTQQIIRMILQVVLPAQLI